MLPSERMAFFQCVSFSSCRFPSASSILSGHWQVKIFMDSVLQSGKPSLCRVHSWPAPQVAPDLNPWLPTFVLPCGGRQLRVHPVAAAPLVCASLLVATHRSLTRPLSPASQLHDQPRLVVLCRFAPTRCLTMRAGPRHFLCHSYGLFSALPASSPPAIDMAFRAPPLPLVNTVNTHALDLYHLALSRRYGPSSLVLSPHTLWLCLVATLRLAVHTLHYLLSRTCHCLALLSRAFPFVRDGSLLTSIQVQTHKLEFQHNNMDALSIVSTHLDFRTWPQPGRITRVSP